MAEDARHTQAIDKACRRTRRESPGAQSGSQTSAEAAVRTLHQDRAVTSAWRQAQTPAS